MAGRSPYDGLDGADLLPYIIAAGLHEQPRDLETFVDSRLVGLTLQQIARRDHISRSAAALRAQRAEHRLRLLLRARAAA